MKILSSKQYGVNLKATIQSTGKLGFSGPTATALELVAGGYIRFAQDDDPDETLYLAVMEGVDNDGFKLMQSGGYYNVTTRSLFDALGVEYRMQTVIYDLMRDASKDEAMGGRAYKMMPRILHKKNGDSGVPDAMPSEQAETEMDGCP